MITFRKATPGDLDALLALYDHVFSAEEAGLTSVGWKRGIYPTCQTLAEALARDDLFLEEADDALVGAAVFNKLQSDYYAPAPWQIDARPNEVMVMHTFAIDPTFRRRGYARAMLDFYERHAREEGCRALRIDTNERNSGALALYASFGFQRITIHPHCFEGLPEIRLQLLEKVLASQSIKEHSAMTVTFRKATAADLDAVSAIYDRIHTEEEAGRTTIGWVRDIYPTRATAEAALARDDLYVELQNDAIVGTAILNHLQGDEYTGAPWQIAADGDHVLVMHKPPKGAVSAPPSRNFTSAPHASKAVQPCASIPMRATFLHAPSIINSAIAKSPSCPASSTASTASSSCFWRKRWSKITKTFQIIGCITTGNRLCIWMRRFSHKRQAAPTIP